mgnify:CR=1 FL=1
MYAVMKLYKPQSIQHLQMKPEMRANVLLVDGGDASIDQQSVDLIIDDVIGSTDAEKVDTSAAANPPNAFYVAAHPDSKCRLALCCKL